MRQFLILFIVFFAFAKAYAQETPKEINIESPINRIDEEKYPGAVVFQKANEQVYIEHDGVDMWCDLAFFYKDDNFVKALGNVRMQQGDSVSMRSQYAEYSGDTKFAFASGKVWLKKDTTTVTTDTMYFDRVKQQAYYRSGGTVTSPNSKITSRIGRYYMEQDKISFVSDVVVTNPEYVINSEQLDFYSEPEHAYLYGPTTITSDGSKVYCERGFYDTRNDLGYFVKNSRIDYDNRVVLGDSLYYDRNKNFASATNNIRVRDSINNTLIKGHYAEVYKDKDSVFITQRAVAITVEKQDSVYIHGDKLIVTGKPEERIVRGFKNVRLFKSDLSGKSDSIHVNQKTGLTQMITRPILWSDLSQITGDSIHLINNVKTEKLDSLKVFDNSFIIQQDSISGFNQVKGQKLYGFFNEENELDKVDILKNAESITYLREDDGSLQGIDKSKSASITVLFIDKAIDEVIKYKGITGTVFPESQFPENARTLEDFNWRGDERLLSKEDIFKGEPPFKLTKIQGIPLPEIQDNFFELPEGTDERAIPGASSLDAETFETRDDDKPLLNADEDESDDSKEKRDALIERNKAASKVREEATKKDSIKLKPSGLKKKKDSDG